MIRGEKIEATMEDREIVALKAQLAQVEKENEMLKFKLLQHENILEGALDAVAIFDENMRFIDVNSAACHMFQLQKKSYVNEISMTFYLLFQAIK